LDKSRFEATGWTKYVLIKRCVDKTLYDTLIFYLLHCNNKMYIYINQIQVKNDAKIENVYKTLDHVKINF